MTKLGTHLVIALMLIIGMNTTVQASETRTLLLIEASKKLAEKQFRKKLFGGIIAGGLLVGAGTALYFWNVRKRNNELLDAVAKNERDLRIYKDYNAQLVSENGEKSKNTYVHDGRTLKLELTDNELSFLKITQIDVDKGLTGDQISLVLAERIRIAELMGVSPSQGDNDNESGEEESDGSDGEDGKRPQTSRQFSRPKLSRLKTAGTMSREEAAALAKHIARLNNLGVPPAGSSNNNSTVQASPARTKDNRVAKQLSTNSKSGNLNSASSNSNQKSS